MKNEHISEEYLKKFYHNQLNQKQQISLFEHAACCPYCSDLLISGFTKETLHTPPCNLAERVFLHIEEKKVAPKRQLFSYSLKVCTAICGALLLLFLTQNLPEQSYMVLEGSKSLPFSEVKSNSVSFLEDICQSLDDFTLQVDTTMDFFLSFPDRKNHNTINNK